MSEFDEALARSVEDGIARGRLPGAADAVRRGRRRSLRARGGVTVLGIAVVAGALGGASALGDGAARPGAGAGPWGAHADEGVLPVTQWPDYDLSHWTLSASCAAADRSKCRPADPVDHAVTQRSVGDMVGQCAPGGEFPVRRFVQFGTQYDTLRKLDADEIVVTFADEDGAATFMAQARTAVSAGICAGLRGAGATSPGVSTAEGVSWLTTGAALDDYGHDYLVQADDRVALLRVNQLGVDTIHGTADDATVLRQMRQALER